MTTPHGGEVRGLARYTYRLRASSTAATALQDEWDHCRWIWNECVARSRKAPAEHENCGPARLDKMLTGARDNNRWLRQGSSVPQQQIIRDYAKSRAKALKDIRARLPSVQLAGMPQHKRKTRCRPSRNYTRRGFAIKDGRLRLAGGVLVTVIWSRELPSVPSSVRVYQDSLGHWYASFVVSVDLRRLPETGRVLGIDWGIRETTTSDTHDLPHPEPGCGTAVRLARYQRMMARRKPPKGQPGSGGYREAKNQTARLHKKIARQRRDTARKWAKVVVADRDHIAVEDFKPKFMTKSTMSRKAADAAIGATKRKLVAMATKHGRIIHLRQPGAHHHGLRRVRCESQARTSPVRTYPYLHGVRGGLSERQELRPGDTGPGWSQPGWC